MKARKMAQHRVLCFGDSLTWGWVPTADGMPTERYPQPVRWTGVLADSLGDDYAVIETAKLADTYGALASFVKVPFFDAGSVISTDGVDGLHFTEENNRDLGVALGREVRAVLGG